MDNIVPLEEIILSDRGVIISQESHYIATWEIGQSMVNFYEHVGANEYKELEPITCYELAGMSVNEVSEYLEEKLSALIW